MRWYIDALRKFAVFSGRSSRKAFWLFLLFSFIVSFILGIGDGLLAALFGIQPVIIPPAITKFLGSRTILAIGWLQLIYAVVICLPTLSVHVRRLHDIGRSGWWYWILLVPFVGIIVLFIFMLLPSNSEVNEYGLTDE